jgi:hypothetical protein
MARIEKRFGYRDTCERESMNEGCLYIIDVRGSDEESVVAVVYAPGGRFCQGINFFHRTRCLRQSGTTAMGRRSRS